MENEKTHLRRNTTAAKFDDLFGGESDLADYHIDADHAPRSLEEVFEQLEVDEEALSHELDTKYHGPTARKRLFDRHRWHHAQREIMHTENEAESEVGKCLNLCVCMHNAQVFMKWVSLIYMPMHLIFALFPIIFNRVCCSIMKKTQM